MCAPLTNFFKPVLPVSLYSCNDIVTVLPDYELSKERGGVSYFHMPKDRLKAFRITY